MNGALKPLNINQIFMSVPNSFQSGTILIALDKDNPVGCCALIKMDADNYELAKMAVSPKAQGKGEGIGLLLGEKIIERTKLIGIKRLYLESNSVLTPAINLYEKLGFNHIKGATSPYERCNVHMEYHFTNEKST